MKMLYTLSRPKYLRELQAVFKAWSSRPHAVRSDRLNVCDSASRQLSRSIIRCSFYSPLFDFVVGVTEDVVQNVI